MIRVGQTPLDHFFGDHEGKVGRLRADFLNRLSAFMLDFASCIALDPLRLGRQPLFIFFHEPLGPLLRRCQNSFGFPRRPREPRFVFF